MLFEITFQCQLRVPARADDFKKLMKNPVIIDSKRMLDAKDFKGAYFYGIGLSHSKQPTKRGFFN